MDIGLRRCVKFCIEYGDYVKCLDLRFVDMDGVFKQVRKFNKNSGVILCLSWCCLIPNDGVGSRKLKS